MACELLLRYRLTNIYNSAQALVVCFDNLPAYCWNVRAISKLVLVCALVQTRRVAITPGETETKRGTFLIDINVRSSFIALALAGFFSLARPKDSYQPIFALQLCSQDALLCSTVSDNLFVVHGWRTSHGPVRDDSPPQHTSHASA
ncbi:hypothetical protein H2248_007872 [Termitomyces sp. 'cryptogamus']|nr:hypothetical protein H2248_007872 [Termitomyces sp. 'cryptogamus']